MDYNKLLEKARKTYSECVTNAEKRRLESLFPELKKSEDECIKEELIKYLNNTNLNSPLKQKWIIWLEKQNPKKLEEELEKAYKCADKIQYKKGYEDAKREFEKQNEKKPTNKIEPKFKVGDWVTNGIDFTFRVMSIKDNMYYRDDDYSIDIETANKTFRLWTIEDAKDGDVLVYKGEIFMIKSYALWNKVVYHCCYDGKNLHKYSIYGSWRKEDFDKVHPATKEQRDLLFKKMHEAGYEWNAEKK